MTNLVLTLLMVVAYAPEVYGIVQGFRDGSRRDAPP